MKLSDQYDDFEVKPNRVHPRYDETLALPLFNKDGDPPETKEAANGGDLISTATTMRP